MRRKRVATSWYSVVFDENHLRITRHKPLKIKDWKIFAGIRRISPDATRNQVWLIATVGSNPTLSAIEFKASSVLLEAFLFEL